MSVTLETEVEFSVICLKCGENLEADAAKKRRGDVVVVAPCKACDETKAIGSFDKGYTEGHREGYAEGRRDACEAATTLLGATP